MMTRYRSAFAVPSGFAVATRTATKGKTTAGQDPATAKLAGGAKAKKGFARPATSVAASVRAA